jgi:cytochrome P450
MSLSAAVGDCPHARPRNALFERWDEPLGAPVVHTDGYWLVSSHALVRDVLLDPETFAPDNALDAVTPMTTKVLRTLTQYGFRLPHTLANNGTASHAGLRAIVTDYLRPAAVSAQRPFVVETVRAQVAAASAALDRDETVDLHAALSHALPLVVLGRMIELPDDDIDVVKRFSASALELFWAPLSPARQEELAHVVGRYHARLREHAASGGGLAASLRAHAAAHGLSDDDVVAVLFFLLVAGQETTSQFLTALLHRLLSTPAIVAELLAGTVSAEAVVAEGLRVDSSVVTWRRVTTRAVVLDGVRIPAGAPVVLRLSAAGRDPAVVDLPDDFVPGQRGSRRHLAFGAGVHRCLGASLATMEAEVVVTEAAALLARCRVLRAPTWSANLSFRMPDALLVTRA